MADRESVPAGADGPSLTASLSSDATTPRRVARCLCFSALFNFAIPAAIYTLFYFLLTYPLLLSWSNSFYCDRGDGLQNEWNLWWIRKAILQLHQSPWFTTWLHAPRGTTLIGHTLNPINGLIGIPLSFIFTKVQVYNLIVTGSFVTSGVTAFWLARHVCRSYLPALFGGFAFTFTGYHFAHAYGHMQLISMEFIPLFLLAWLRFLEEPGFARALAAAAVLGLVELCDFYYLLYCGLSGALCVFFYFRHLKLVAQGHGRAGHYLMRRFGVFALAASLFCGPLLIALLVSDARDPLGGAHADVLYSSDLFSAFLPGEVNLLGRFSNAYWSRLNHNPTDESVYVGLSVIALAVYGVTRRRDAGVPVGFWICVAISSYVLSLGPVLHICGAPETDRVLPYAWLEMLLPPLKLSGIPARFSIMLALAVSMLASVGVAQLFRRQNIRSFLVLTALAVVVGIDLCPGSLPTTPVFTPAWTTALRKLPRRGAVICQVYDRTVDLYCQTLFDRPTAFGYISRVPWSVFVSDQRIIALLQANDFATLCDMGFVYVVLPRPHPMPGLPIVYSDDEVNIQELPNSVRSKP